MSEQMMQGLQISVIGMGLTFFALALLVLVLVLLDRLFRTKGGAPTLGEFKPGDVEPYAAEPGATEVQDEEVAVAIAVALSYLGLQELDRGALGDTLAHDRGAWWRGGRSARPVHRSTKKPMRGN
jgi:Na+-transporting methylmalonyl-CoA/oxaloacetate decarboxylase gamma subunit